MESESTEIEPRASHLSAEGRLTTLTPLSSDGALSTPEARMSLNRALWQVRLSKPSLDEVEKISVAIDCWFSTRADPLLDMHTPEHAGCLNLKETPRPARDRLRHRRLSGYRQCPDARDHQLEAEQ